MSNIVKYQIVTAVNPELMSSQKRVTHEVMANYPEILAPFNTLYQRAVEAKDQVKNLLKEFEACKDDDQKLALAHLAKQVLKSLNDIKGDQKGTKGATGLKAEWKEQSKGYVNTIDACFNAVADLVDNLKEDAQKVSKYEQEIKAKRLQALRDERLDQLQVLDLAQFLLEGTDLAEFTPEMWDTQLGQWQMLLDAKKAKEEAERLESERLAKEEAMMAKLREMRGNMLAKFQYFHAGDLAELDEVAFMGLLEEAEKAMKAKREKEEAERAQREKEAKERAEKMEAERAQREKEAKEEAVRQAKLQAEREAQLAKEREERAKLEAELKAKRDAEAKEEALRQKGDVGKLTSVANKIREVEVYLNGMVFTSEKGLKAQGYIHKKLEILDASIKEMSKKLVS